MEFAWLDFLFLFCSIVRRRSKKWMKKALPSLQAFVDDSASDADEQRLFMAGYLNYSEKWALFSEAWREELKVAPSIDYLKMSEANALADQFNGWDAKVRDEKLRSLVRVINHFKHLYRLNSPLVANSTFAFSSLSHREGSAIHISSVALGSSPAWRDMSIAKK